MNVQKLELHLWKRLQMKLIKIRFLSEYQRFEQRIRGGRGVKILLEEIRKNILKKKLNLIY